MPAPKYYEIGTLDECLNSMLELKNKPKPGLDVSEVLERAKPFFLECLKENIPAYMLVEHFHKHNIDIPANKIKSYISSIRPKQKPNRKTRKVVSTITPKEGNKQ